MTSQAQSPPTWAAAQLRLRTAVGDWIRKSIARQQGLPWQGGHDEGSFVASWFGYYLLTGDHAVLDFLRWLGEGFLRWTRANLFHGYYAEGEAHHQPENFIFFLPRLWHVDSDPRVAEALDDAAHHAGNWVEGSPPWYDWERHRFRSWRLGTRQVISEPPCEIEHPDHFRIVHMALCAYRAAGDERYVDLARDFCGRWAREILAGDPLPALRRFKEDGADERYPRGLVGSTAAGPEERLELHIGAGTTDALLDLFAVTREESLAAAARKILACGAHLLGEPHSHPLAAAWRKYRIITGDTTLDSEIETRVGPSEADAESAMLLLRPRGPHPMGVGQRRDQVSWVISEGGERWRPDQRPSSAALVLNWDVTGDEKAAAQAMNMAAERMELGAAALADGREHGCAGRTVTAVASGHGRSAGIGEVTGTLYPLALGAFRRFGADDPQALISHEDRRGLPEGCAALWRHSRPRRLQIFNSGKEPAHLAINLSPPGGEAGPAAREVVVGPGELLELEAGGT